MRVRLRSPLHRGRELLSAAALGAGLLGASACGDSTGPATPFEVSGTLTGAQLAALPAGARVVVLWVVSSGDPDYIYAYGNGTIDRAAGTFSIRLPNRPPAAALNSYGVGVGVVLAIRGDATIPTGRLTSEAVLDAAALGGAGDYGIIYKGPAANDNVLWWSKAFPRGYAVGRGLRHDVPDLYPYDGFERVPANSVELIIDDIDLIDFVNWT